MTTPGGDAPTRLARRLGALDATFIGLGAMVGAGVFVAFAPAAAAAGSGLLIGLAIAATVAAANATSSARLAARYPSSGGTYVYGRERLGRGWGFLAGWAFVTGKTASCAAMALTFAAYAAPGVEKPAAVAAVILLAAVNIRGVGKTAAVTRVLVVAVLVALAVAVVGALGGGEVSTARVGEWWPDNGVRGVLRAGGFLFFAFAGYARIATLGEEVRDPARTIPRAIGAALTISVAIYALVGVGILLAIGPNAVAQASAPLVAAVEAGRFDALAPIVRLGAVLATLSVLLSLLAGVGRTAFAMAANEDLPRALSTVHQGFHTPLRAEIAAAAIVVVAIALFDVRGAIGFSSANVLTYYAVANASALTLPGGWSPARIAGVIGLVGCVTLAVMLPTASVIGGAIVLGAGIAGWFVKERFAGGRGTHSA